MTKTELPDDLPEPEGTKVPMGGAPVESLWCLTLLLFVVVVYL